MPSGIPYKVFANTHGELLQCIDQSFALGEDTRERDLLRERYGLMPGDVLYLNTTWWVMDSAGEWVNPLPEQDPRFVYGQNPWSATLANALLQKADQAAHYQTWTQGLETRRRKRRAQESP